jgi:glucosylceramidase
MNLLPKMFHMFMRFFRSVLFACCLLFVCCSYSQTRQLKRTAQSAALWLTDPGKAVLFQQQPAPAFSTAKPAAGSPLIRVDDSQRFQTMDGFGFTLTGGSAMHLAHMNAPARAALLRELFGTTGNGIGTSYLRISIGSSDLDDRVFTYDDLPAGQTDKQMAHFSLAPDKKFLIPVLKEILAINPAIKILGSPWSPPSWMKTNDSSKGGSLKTDCYDAYALYFVRYIKAMRAEGITIDAITIQNEPLNPKNNPSMVMEPDEQAAFIKNSLGPLFRKEGIRTKILLYDHNADRPDYPITILNDREAALYVDGSAFHLYGGTIEALQEVHKAHPDKHLYFTEQWVGAPGNLKGDLLWHVKHVIIGAARNWCRNALEWNLAANSKLEPHTPGGCTQCLGAITIDGNNVTRNPAYYIIAHAARFVRPGSVRIASDTVAGLPNVAFITPSGQKVLIVENEGNSPVRFGMQDHGKYIVTTLNAGAVGTYVWK